MLCDPARCYQLIASEFNRIAHKTVLVHTMSKELEQQKPGRMPLLAAKAMSSVGFALSVLAIWLDWILPVARPLVPELPILHPPTREKPHRRRSAPASFGSNAVRRSRKRRAIPARANTSPTARDTHEPSTTTTVREAVQVVSDTPEPTPAADVDDRQLSSSSTLVATPPKHLAFQQPQLDTCDESVESDGSRMSCGPSPHPRLPRMKLLLSKTRKASLNAEPSPPAASTSSECQSAPSKPLVTTPNSGPSVNETPVKPARKRPASGFVPPWILSRSSITSDITSETLPKTASPARSFFSRRPSSARQPTSPQSTRSSIEQPPRPSTPTPVSATTAGFCRSKVDRRRSAPVPRTQPYEYPYFAAMPTPYDDVNVVEEPVVKREPVDEVGRLTTRNSASPEPIVIESDGRIGRPNSRQVNAIEQAQLGLGRRPSSKRRSTSESWAQRSVSRS
ncbi:hypothetical protein CCMSSC00406_0002745 [Pleurotus cornucopiae]|uniref:Uncharacterized protein n=1 Tax=Pleurotus cornucopiae TaxID=5321 RepID=A0ACB7IW96_PLECO|nr:hypothetical protein CCMSSC00406_0002745 [Pleurotus cornucopiae]